MIIDLGVPPVIESTEQAEDKDSNNNNPTEEEDKDLYSLQTDTPQWSIMNWPFVEASNEIRSYLLEKGTYDVQPLAAYTADETLISPQDYIQELSGSIAIVSFQVKFALPWIDSKQNKIVHTTDLVQIRVIAKASQFQSKSPKKRLPPSKPLFGSSSKKRFF